MTKAFDKIMAGLDDALAYVNGDETRARVAIGPDVKAIRAATKKSQQAFADSYHLPIGTLRDWEQGRRQPDAPARVLLSLIERDPVAVERMLEKAG